MNWHVIGWGLVLISVFLGGCQHESAPPPGQAAKATIAGDAASRDEQGSLGSDSKLPEIDLAAKDLSSQVAELNRQVALPPSEFRAGSSEPLEFDAERITRNAEGFVIKLRSESPIPTPTVHNGRLYVSGGFSSKEYYCFDAKDGTFIWGAQLDDDGPSSAVPYQDCIIFGCESCTLFALDAATGRLRWAHWLGDPLLSTPTVAGDRVFTVYPAIAEQAADANSPPPPPPPPQPSAPPVAAKQNEPPCAEGIHGTHILACFEAGTGKLLWRRWLSSDCMTAPIAVGSDLIVAALDGNVYWIAQDDGEMRTALALRATSAPVVVEDRLFLTRRADIAADKNVTECVALHDRSTHALQYFAAVRHAPYLDANVQRKSTQAAAAGGFEHGNGIMGGFGGGFNAVPPEKVGEASKPPASQGQVPPPPPPPAGAEEASKPQPPLTHATTAKSGDGLSFTQAQAAGNIGMGNVSTIQGFQGSRVLYSNGALINCMGDQVVCTAARDGKSLWTLKLEGDLEKSGGHLGAAPVAAGGYVFIATAAGKLLQIDSQAGKTVKSYEIGSPLRFPPAIQDGRIYVGTQDGKLVCIDTRNVDLTGWPMLGGDAARQNVATVP